MMKLNDYIIIGREVKEAINKGKAVVALESTIISHGMPYPDNYKTAILLEEEIRNKGAVPATIAIMGGKIRVGLTNEEIEQLAKAKDVIKVSRRDIPYVIAMKKDGATTVASTMIFAAMAGIAVFATGGIGGVHRGAQSTFDISADLTELSNTNVTVVCAGAKSILDIGLTLETLESLGVPVIGYKTDEFPAFYTRKSGFAVDCRVETPSQIAAMIKVKLELGQKGGMIVGNPIPLEYEADSTKINFAIEEALKEAEVNKIRGKEVTPFLLKKVKDLTNGESLESNIALVRNNAALAGEIAVELAKKIR
jgi:pseudouridine-5'-phosphate glycosidase